MKKQDKKGKDIKDILYKPHHFRQISAFLDFKDVWKMLTLNKTLFNQYIKNESMYTDNKIVSTISFFQDISQNEPWYKHIPFELIRIATKDTHGNDNYKKSQLKQYIDSLGFYSNSKFLLTDCDLLLSGFSTVTGNPLTKYYRWDDISKKISNLLINRPKLGLTIVPNIIKESVNPNIYKNIFPSCLDGNKIKHIACRNPKMAKIIFQDKEMSDMFKEIYANSRFFQVILINKSVTLDDILHIYGLSLEGFISKLHKDTVAELAKELPKVFDVIFNDETYYGFNGKQLAIALSSNKGQNMMINSLKDIQNYHESHLGKIIKEGALYKLLNNNEYINLIFADPNSEIYHTVISNTSADGLVSIISKWSNIHDILKDEHTNLLAKLGGKIGCIAEKNKELAIKLFEDEKYEHLLGQMDDIVICRIVDNNKELAIKLFGDEKYEHILAKLRGKIAYIVDNNKELAIKLFKDEKYKPLLKKMKISEIFSIAAMVNKELAIKLFKDEKYENLLKKMEISEIFSIAAMVNKKFVIELFKDEKYKPLLKKMTVNSIVDITNGKYDKELEELLTNIFNNEDVVKNITSLSPSCEDYNLWNKYLAFQNKLPDIPISNMDEMLLIGNTYYETLA